MKRLPLALAALCAAVLLAGPAIGGEQPLDEPFQKILAYKLGGDAGPVSAVANLARDSFTKPEERKKVEQQLLAALGSPKATADCKKFVCRQLVVVGSPKAVPALAAMLPDPELSHMARYALARIDDPSAGKALRDALGRVKGLPLLGIIGSLGDRRDREALPALTQLARSSDAAVAEAAVAALGKIGGDAALAAIEAAVKSGKPKLAAVALDAKLRCADRFVAEDKKSKARAIYDGLYTSAKSVHIRTAALRGMVRAGSDEASTIVMKPLFGDDRAMQAAAVGLIRDIPGEAAARSFAAQLPKLSSSAQVLLIDALADRGDKAAGPAVLVAAKSKYREVRAAALRALGKLGDASAVRVLVAATASPNADEVSAARYSLVRLAAPGVDDAVLAALRAGDAKARVELIRCLASRRAAGTVPALIKLVEDKDESVRREAFKAIGSLADEKALPDLVKLLVEAKGNSARRAAEKAVVIIASRLKNEDDRTAALLGALPSADDDGKASLFRILAKFGGAKALAAVGKSISAGDRKVVDAAVRALSNWPDAAAADTLLSIIKTTKNNTHRVLALRGYIRLVALPSERSAAETLKRCQEAMTLATNLAEKKLVLSAMANVHHPGAVKVIQPYAADPQLKAEALAAIKKIKAAMNKPARATGSHNAHKAKNALDGNPKTRWDTGRAMSPGMWFQLEFGMERTFTKLTLECKGSGGDYPRGYEVYVSRDGKNWAKPVAKGQGKSPVVEITLKPASGRFLKIVQTGRTKGSFWSIHTLQIESK